MIRGSLRAVSGIVVLLVSMVLLGCSGPGSGGASPVATAAATAMPASTIARPTATPLTAAVGSSVATAIVPLASPTATIPAPTPARTAAIATAPVASRAAEGSATPSAPVTPAVQSSTGPLPPAYRIAFVSTSGGSDDIWTMDPDGRRLTNLTKTQKAKGNDSDPQWSPDGRRIAFVSDRDGNPDIWVMNVDGSGARNLTRAPADDVNPRWSPDGRRIVFVAFRDGDAELYAMNADGSEQTNLTKADGDDLQPAWSPDGAQIAFVSERQKKPRGLYVLSIDAPKTPTRVAAPPCDMGNPAWSPDGRTLAVVACLGADGQGGPDPLIHAVYSIPAAGGNLTTVSEPKLDSGGPTWSADGRMLAFWTYRTTQQAEIVLVTVGANERRVIQAPPGVAREPAWSLDSTTLAFVGGDFTIGNVIVADLGGLSHNITNHAANDRSPRWSPQKLP